MIRSSRAVYAAARAAMCFMLILSMLLGLCIAGHASQTTDGVSFEQTRLVASDRAFESVPLTFEAWVYVPKSQSARSGVVLGNYRGSANVPSINFEIHKNGRPRLYIVDTEKNAHDFTFSADVRTGDYAHVAIVCDTSLGVVRCYVNGKLVGAKSGNCTPERESIVRQFLIGGDYRSGNAQYFKGQIRSVSLYSEARSAEQINEDMNAVDKSSGALIASFEPISSLLFADVSGNGYRTEEVKTWYSDKEPVEGYAYSFCVVGDTQKVVYNDPDKLACIYDWIVDNKSDRKIEFVFGLGDITDKNTKAEWECAQREISKLNGVVPYSLVRGNHDGSDNYNKYLGSAEYKSSCAGKYHPTKIENTYHEFTAGGVKYLNITLDYGASDALLTWAGRIITEHPEHRVIITTHAYLYRDGTTLDVSDVCPPNTTGTNDGVKNNGDQIWDKLISKHENIFLVLSGHDPCDDVVVTQSEGIHGNVVTQMLIDPQGVDNAQGSTGMITMLYFSEDGEHITIETYSTVREQYYLSTNQRTIRIPKYQTDGSDESADSDPVQSDKDTADAPEQDAVTDSASASMPADEQQTQSGISAAVWILLGCVGAVLACVCIVVSVNGAKKKKARKSRKARRNNDEKIPLAAGNIL